MGSREAFQLFIRYQLRVMCDTDEAAFKEEAIEKIASSLENDPVFYEKFVEFLNEFIEDYMEEEDKTC